MLYTHWGIKIHMEKWSRDHGERRPTRLKSKDWMIEWWKFRWCVKGRFFISFQYTVQEGRPHEKLSDNIQDVSHEDLLMVAGDMNCHIGSTCDGFEDVMESFSFGVRNQEGETCWDCVKSITWELWTYIIERGGNNSPHTKVGEIKVRSIMCCIDRHIPFDCTSYMASKVSLVAWEV